MRFASLLAGASLAVAAPALSQTMPSSPAQPTTAPQAGDPATPATAPSAPTSAVPSGAPAPAGTPIPTSTPLVQPAVGGTVLDPSGATVGTIKSMDSQYVTLATDKGEARLPVSGIGPGPGGAVVGVSKAQLDAAVEKAKAAEPKAAATRKKQPG